MKRDLAAREMLGAHQHPLAPLTTLPWLIPLYRFPLSCNGKPYTWAADLIGAVGCVPLSNYNAKRLPPLPS